MSQDTLTEAETARERATISQNHYELQNYTSIVHGKHMIKLGGRLRDLTDTNSSEAGFNNTYLFSSSAAYAATLAAIPSGATGTAVGDSAYQFSFTTGIPASYVSAVRCGTVRSGRLSRAARILLLVAGCVSKRKTTSTIAPIGRRAWQLRGVWRAERIRRRP